MRQLVELNRSAAKFEEMGVEVIAVFREEKAGVAGLQKIKSRTETPFTLVVDLGAENTAGYSNGRKEFDNYVINPAGEIVAVIDGTLRERASAEQILTALEGIAGEAAADGSDTKGSDAKEEPGSDTKEPGSDTKGSGVKAEPEPAGSAKKAGSGSR